MIKDPAPHPDLMQLDPNSTLSQILTTSDHYQHWAQIFVAFNRKVMSSLVLGAAGQCVCVWMVAPIGGGHGLWNHVAAAAGNQCKIISQTFTPHF